MARRARRGPAQAARRSSLSSSAPADALAPSDLCPSLQRPPAPWRLAVRSGGPGSSRGASGPGPQL
eukprot:858486-Lingulodinium_polyedra.AAC.1